MIKNQYQAGVAKRRIRELSESLEAADELSRGQYLDLLEEVSEELAEFEDIAGGRITDFSVESLDEVVLTAIKARIARGLSHAQLAGILGVSEQQVQRDEAQEYSQASWVRVADVLDALDFELVGQVRQRTGHDESWGNVITVDFDKRRATRDEQFLRRESPWHIEISEFANG